jgi:flagellar biosynthesis/type III secretory pathway protein FliH
MAKTSLAPGLTAFMESYKNLLDQSELSKSTASHNAIELALLITEKIIDQTTVELDHDLSELKETITEALMETNRLSLNVNPDDLSELESMLSQDGFDATSHPQVSIVKNNAIQPGELLIEVQSEALDAVDQKILDKLSQILAKTAAVD